MCLSMLGQTLQWMPDMGFERGAVTLISKSQDQDPGSFKCPGTGTPVISCFRKEQGGAESFTKEPEWTRFSFRSCHPGHFIIKAAYLRMEATLYPADRTGRAEGPVVDHCWQQQEDGVCLPDRRPAGKAPPPRTQHFNFSFYCANCLNDNNKGLGLGAREMKEKRSGK